MKFYRGLKFSLPISLALWGMVAIAGVKAFGQEQDTPRARAYLGRINAEIGSNLECSVSALTLQDRLQKTERELAEVKKQLADKVESKPLE